MNYNTINGEVTIPEGVGGALLAGRFRVVRQLGQGGMGSVWLAEDVQLDNKPFAIKMLPSILVSNKRAYRQLKDEALVAMKLVHSNIVQLRAFEENGGNPFLVMDYVDGQTLDDYLAEEGNGELGMGNGLSESEVLRLLKPIAAALDYAHGKGVVHRDVKPGNVMVAKDGTPCILDFGIAREIQETMTRVTGKLSSGTLLYMSPEQLNGDAPTKEQDIYSFAAMAYECIKGEPPFVRGAIEDQIKNKQPAPLTTDALTGEAAILAAGVMAGLAKKPEDRPATCAAVLEGDFSGRVERVDGVGGARRPAEPVGSRVPRDRSGGPRSAAVVKGILAAACGAALAGGGYYGWMRYDESVKAKEKAQAEERARQEKLNEERVAKLKAEKEKYEAEKQKVEAEIKRWNARVHDRKEDYGKIADLKASRDYEQAMQILQTHDLLLKPVGLPGGEDFDDLAERTKAASGELGNYMARKMLDSDDSGVGYVRRAARSGVLSALIVGRAIVDDPPNKRKLREAVRVAQMQARSEFVRWSASSRVKVDDPVLLAHGVHNDHVVVILGWRDPELGNVTVVSPQKVDGEQNIEVSPSLGAYL